MTTIEKLQAAKAQEELIMQALCDAYQRGQMAYLYYQHGYDASAARAAALSFAIAAEQGEQI